MPWFWSPTLFFRGPWWKVLAMPHSVQLHRMHSARRVFVVILQFFPGQTILLPQHHCYDSGWGMSSGSPRITREPVRSDDKVSCRLEGRGSCPSKGTGLGIHQSPVDEKTRRLPWNTQGGPESWLDGGPGKRDFWIKRGYSVYQAPLHMKNCATTASLTTLTMLLRSTRIWHVVISLYAFVWMCRFVHLFTSWWTFQLLPLMLLWWVLCKYLCGHIFILFR